MRQIWAEGRPVINGWCSLGSPLVAEAMAAQGWDALTIDGQHGLVGYSEMLGMLQAMRASPVTPMVRVSWNVPGEIMRALDAGALGIICPMINSRAECEAFVAACRYPPLGSRSFGPIRAAQVYGPEYVTRANTDVLTLAMVETKDGMDDLQEIVTTPGLDGVYVGPADLAFAHGLTPMLDTQEPAMLARFETIVAACKSAGVRAGIHTGAPAYAVQMLKAGFDLVTVGGDLRYLMAGRRDTLEMHEAITKL